MKNKNKNKNRHKNRSQEPLESEDIEDILSMGKDDLEDARDELKRDSEHSQAEGLAKHLSKVSDAERMEALRRLRREDILLFETVEYLLKRIPMRKV